jgi:FAD/FMN-containing dehydrogenase
VSVVNEKLFHMTVVLSPTDSVYADIAASLEVHSTPLIARPRTPADIAEILVAYPQVTVRSGGHGGYEAPDGTLLLDLSAFCDIEVLEGGLVRVGTGAVWGAVAETLGAHHLALTSGDTYTVGVGGLTLGGGVGWMVRQHGLALDSLVAAEVVLPSGRIVTASAQQEPELFWAIRGGGGNFGVVTTFTFQAHPLDGVLFGTITLDPAVLPQTLKAWRDVMRAAPRDLNVTYLGLPGFGPDAPPTSQFVVGYGGVDAGSTIDPLLSLPGVLETSIGPARYADVLERMEKPEGEIAMVDNNSFADDFSDELIDDLVDAHESFGGAVLMIRYVRGALNEVAPDATAFAHRGAEVLLISAAFLAPDAPASEHERIRSRWAALAPRTSGLYGNFSPTRSDAITELMYPPATLSRLRAAKRLYDPENVLRQNHNVMP